MDSNSSKARTAINGTTETQQRWVVNGDERHDGDLTAIDGNGRHDRDLKAMDRLTAMGSDSMVMDGAAGCQWMVWRDVNGRRDGSLMTMEGVAAPRRR